MEIEYVVVKATPRPTKAVQAIIDAKTEAGQCLLCQADAKWLGLCQRHHRQYLRALEAVPKGKQELFRAKLISLGKLLESRQGRRTDEPDQFREIAANFEGK